MKKARSIRTILVLLTLAGTGAVVATSLMAIETPAYNVLTSESDFEIRSYEAYIVAQTVVSGDLDQASDEGFRRLAGYIFGNNRDDAKTGGEPRKIAMTAPVNMVPAQDSENRWTMTFMMPSEYEFEELPQPLDSRVQLLEKPAATMAAVRFSGRWTATRADQHQAKLEKWIADRGLSAEGPAIFARYDPPYKPWFLRRNEILIPIANSDRESNR